MIDDQQQPDQNQPTPTDAEPAKPPESQAEVQTPSVSSPSEVKAPSETEIAPSPQVPQASQPSVEGLPPQESVGRILLVEDDLTLAKMYATKLKQERFEVELACDGESGLAKIGEWNPDLVVLDLMVPKIGGIELLTQLRADPKGKTLPVVILSNLSQAEDIQRCNQLGVKEFLVKADFTPSQVVEKIKQYLKK